jgi:hypothetical protein
VEIYSFIAIDLSKEMLICFYKIDKYRIPKKAQHGKIENVAGSV